MFYKLLSKLDSLFEVKQTKYTGTRIFLTFCIVILMVMSLPMYFKYEDHNYAKYSNEYTTAKQLIFDYVDDHGEYPVGEKIDYKKEKDLIDFLNNNIGNRQLYYVDTDLIPELKGYKYTYVLDTHYKFVYTSEFVVFEMSRWHYAR